MVSSSGLVQADPIQIAVKVPVSRQEFSGTGDVAGAGVASITSGERPVPDHNLINFSAKIPIGGFPVNICSQVKDRRNIIIMNPVSGLQLLTLKNTVDENPQKTIPRIPRVHTYEVVPLSRNQSSAGLNKTPVLFYPAEFKLNKPLAIYLYLVTASRI